MNRALRLTLLGLLLAAPAFAGPADTPDASAIPDASVGQGGADQASPESIDSSRACTRDSDCDRGALCVNQVCGVGTTRNATFLGCAVAPGPALVAGLLVAFLFRRRS